MLASTPGLVLHTTPYAETSVVVKVFTRLFGVRSYIIKGVRGHGGRVKQNMLQPLTSLDMVVYVNPKNELNHIKELSPRHPDTQAAKQSSNQAIDNALRFFMTEVLYKALREAEPMPALWDYVDTLASENSNTPVAQLPILFLLTTAQHLGISPLDNHSALTPYFCLEEGRYVATANETTLSIALSSILHEYLPIDAEQLPSATLADRRNLIDALIAYYHLHLSGFSHFHSHEILHTILQ